MKVILRHSCKQLVAQSLRSFGQLLNKLITVQNKRSQLDLLQTDMHLNDCQLVMQSLSFCKHVQNALPHLKKCAGDNGTLLLTLI